jgi:hypothetical protein
MCGTRLERGLLTKATQNSTGVHHGSREQDYSDHEVIREWTEKRGGRPAAVKDTGYRKDDPGIIRIDFPGYGGEDSLEHVSWHEWFEKLDHGKLAFLYQEETKDGEQSTFNKLVDRESVEAKR